jgi:hypothetical protein
MSDTSKKQYSASDFEPYFVEIMDMLAAFKQILREEAVEPTVTLFKEYNTIVSSLSAQLDVTAIEIRSILEKTRDTFDILKKKSNKIKAPKSAPPELVVFLNTARDTARSPILSCLKASELLIGYVDNRNPSDLSKVYEMLKEIAV